MLLVMYERFGLAELALMDLDLLGLDKALPPLVEAPTGYRSLRANAAALAQKLPQQQLAAAPWKVRLAWAFSGKRRVTS
jgi:hypothetical protein